MCYLCSGTVLYCMYSGQGHTTSRRILKWAHTKKTIAAIEIVVKSHDSAMIKVSSILLLNPPDAISFRIQSIWHFIVILIHAQ